MLEIFCCSSIETCFISVLVLFFYFHTPLFWLWALLKPIGFPDVIFYAETLFFLFNHYSESLLDPENWWCILVQFEKFEQIWGTVQGRTFKLKKKDLKNPYVSHFICLLTYNYLSTYSISKQCMPAKLLLVQNWGNMAHFPQPTTGTSFGNFIYTTIACNDTPLSLTISNFMSWS